MTIEKRKVIYIPVQHVNRDLAGALLLAKEATERGWKTVLFKAKWLLDNIDKIEKGVVCYGTSPTTVDDVKRIKEAGHFYVARCDEAAMWNKQRYLVLKAHPKNLEKADLYLAWSDKHKEIVCEAYPALAVTVVGNERMDLGTVFSNDWEHEVSMLRKRMGDFVLITSNGKTVYSRNTHKDFESVALDLSKRFSGWPESEHLLAKQQFNENGLAFSGLIRDLLQRYPDVNFVYRPRFGDDVKTLKRELGYLKNVKLVPEGSINPLIIASTGVIHQNCTTGFEAALLRKPTINYSPIHLKYPYLVAEHVLPKASNAMDVYRFVEQVRVGSHEKYLVSKEKMYPYAFNANGGSACSSIMDAIEKAFGTSSLESSESVGYSSVNNGLRYEMSHKLRSLFRWSKRGYRQYYSEDFSSRNLLNYLRIMGLDRKLEIVLIQENNAFHVSTGTRI